MQKSWNYITHVTELRIGKIKPSNLKTVQKIANALDKTTEHLPGSSETLIAQKSARDSVMFCNDFVPLKRMYRVAKCNRFIFFNNDLTENTQRIVYQPHREPEQNSPIREFMLYDMKEKPEYEANIVASWILPDSDEVLNYIYNHRYTAEQIAKAMPLIETNARRSQNPAAGIIPLFFLLSELIFQYRFHRICDIIIA